MSASSTTCKSEELNGLARIMRLAFGGDNLTQLTTQLVQRLRSDPNDAGALMDLSVVYQLNAQPQVAMELQALALQQRQYFRFQKPLPSTASAFKLLAIMGPGEVMANTPIEFLVEDCDVVLELLYLGEGLPAPSEIPDHDVAFVAVCESDQNQQLLHLLSDVMQHWPRPFLNAPECIAQLSRDRVSSKLAQIDGVITSDAHRLQRAEIAEVAAMAPELFPIIARPVNSHGGHGLSKLEVAADARDYLQQHADEEFFVAPFIDYRSADGLYRKARVAVIDGQPFAAHLAISHNWMVHYLNADMLESPLNRQQEAEFMASFDDSFAARHRSALEEIDSRVGLDYYSIDCAETQDGRLVVFELDSGAVVHAMDSSEIFPYKAPQMKRIFTAFRNLLQRTAAGIPRTLPFEAVQPVTSIRIAA